MASEAHPAPPDTDPAILNAVFADWPGSGKWLARWEAAFPAARRIDLGAARAAHRTRVVNAINLEVHGAQRPVVLAAHGLACLAVATWADLERPEGAALIRGALLFDPPLPQAPGEEAARAEGLGDPRRPLQFPTCILASHKRGAAELYRLRRLARQWGCYFDSIPEGSLPRARIVHPVQSLGERFFAQTMRGIAPYPERGANAPGYPVDPR